MVETVRCRHMLSNRMSCRHSDLDRGHFMLCKNHLAHKKKERKKATSGNKSWFMFPQRASYEKFTCCLIFSSYMCECVMLCNVVWCCVMLCNVGSSPLSQISSLRLPRGYQGKCSRSLSYSKSSCGRPALSTMTLTSPLRPLSTLHSPLWSGPPPTSSTSSNLLHLHRAHTHFKHFKDHLLLMQSASFCPFCFHISSFSSGNQTFPVSNSNNTAEDFLIYCLFSVDLFFNST